jgi:carboxymethylenebutenolidase
VKEVAAAHPDVEVHIYPADHRFNCDQRESYDAPSAALAWTRTIAFLKKHVGLSASLRGSGAAGHCGRDEHE